MSAAHDRADLMASFARLLADRPSLFGNGVHPDSTDASLSVDGVAEIPSVAGTPTGKPGIEVKLTSRNGQLRHVMTLGKARLLRAALTEWIDEHTPTPTTGR